MGSRILNGNVLTLIVLVVARLSTEDSMNDDNKNTDSNNPAPSSFSSPHTSSSSSSKSSDHRHGRKQLSIGRTVNGCLEAREALTG